MFPIDHHALAGVFTLLPIEDVHHGPGAIARLEAALAARGITRALLITGRSLATRTPLVERVCSAAGGRIAAVFHDTIQHVHRQSVLRAAARAREIGADGIVSFGGGTPNDTGKAVVMALAADLREPQDFERLRVKFTYPDRVEVPALAGAALPMIAISTTLSGGEFTHFAGVTDEVRKVKDLYIDRRLAARAVFLDAELTLETPPALWLSTGMRAVDHCVEALCSTNAHPFVDALASHALGELNRTLRLCKRSPDDLHARTQAQIAAWMSVCGLANVNLGLSHGIGHQLGARNNVPHGVTSCVMMVPTMEFNRAHVGARQAWIARCMDVEIAGLAPEQAAAAGRDAVRRLVRDLELPQRLREVGVSRDDFAAIARDALEDLIVATNPRPVRGVDEVVAVLESAY
ncbi:MAG TPA: iron-containing alcohol dehydrogenase [Gammaproteobacteria bacterium]|nr:iron-containing alcohol dehydrogenase [Gammaproteobacteria bacterium]